MANTTVNDVMNVINNSDYGIKSIAGTNKEILAILQGTTNSQNNLHAIVDDVKTLLQKLVTVATEKKPIEIGNKPTKINHKHIQDILDETKGIRKSIDNLTKSILKQGTQSNPTIAKLSDKASEQVAAAMVKDIEKQNKGEGMSALIDTFTKLKDISLKDIIFGNIKIKKISKLFKTAKENLSIEKKELDNIIKLINASPEMIKSLRYVSWRINRIIKNNVIEKLRTILVGENSLLSLAMILQKNEKIFDKASKASKSIKELIISLNKALTHLSLTSILAKLASKGVDNIAHSVNKIIELSNILVKNKKDIDASSKAAKQMTVLVGNLLTSSILLTIAAVTGGPAILGAKLLSKIVDNIIPIVEKLSSKNKQIKKATKSAISLIAFTGLMAVSSIFLASIAVTGVPALLGSILTMGIVAINVITFDILSKAKKNILNGSISMLLMSGSLLLFGVALNKITQATKGVDFKQIGVIATLTLLLGGTVALLGIPAVVPFIILGSISMGIMGLALMPFAITLGKIAKATENLKMKQILLVTTSMVSLGTGIAGMAFLAIPVAIGSITVLSMANVLQKYAKALKSLNGIGSSTTKIVHQTLNSLNAIGDFFSKNWLNPLAIINAINYKLILKPFGKTLKHLSKINELGSIPMKLVHQTLNAMSTIGNFYKENPITLKTIWQARRYKRMLRPFGKTLKYFGKLKELGSIPMKLVHQTLNAMSTIANYYLENPIEKKVIKQARSYKRMLHPFGKTLKYFGKLKELGSIPMKLMHQTLNAMSTIANYYLENPIEKKVIKQARKYKRMLRPFGKTLKYFGKLKELGSIPMKLVHQTLNAMSTIANYYLENPIERKVIKQARRYKRMLKPFGKAIKHLSNLKELGSIPMKLVYQTLNAISTISDFYKKQDIGFFEGTEISLKATMINNIVSNFGKAVKSFKDFKDIQSVPSKSIESVVSAINSIYKFYDTIYFSDDIESSSNIGNIIVNKFTSIANNIKNNTQGLNENDFNGVKIAINSIKNILNFLKEDTLNVIEIYKAKKTLKVLDKMTSVISNISNINHSNLSSIGNTLSNTLDSVKTIDMNQVQAVTNMFNAFNSINKSESIINKFTESVKEFTSTCKNLMESMNYNTDAINNMDTTAFGGSYINETRDNNIIGFSSDTNTNRNGINITNVEEIARTIAEKINSTLSVDIPDTQVQLLINGQGGNEWTISRY